VLVAGIRNREDFARFITQEPLLETKPSLAGISQIPDVEALYFGLGLCNGVPMLSAGLPVDVLSMILTGEQLEISKHILLADTHAITNGFDAQSTNRLAGHYQEALHRAVENLGFSGWQVTRASEIDQTSTYKDLLSTIEASHDYIRRELADMRWFNQEHRVNLKVGWALNGSKNSDERSFDQEFQRQFDDPLGFIYVIPGRTFDPNRLRSAPYFCTNPEERILLHPDENVAHKITLAQEKFGQQATRPYEKFLSQVIRLYDKTVERTERGPIAGRLQQVIDRCTQ
tara:strand:+ start:328 stop:1185 length:858 start_codon:yes stop_codon:yes gene_type:complete